MFVIVCVSLYISHTVILRNSQHVFVGFQSLDAGLVHHGCKPLRTGNGTLNPGTLIHILHNIYIILLYYIHCTWVAKRMTIGMICEPWIYLHLVSNLEQWEGKRSCSSRQATRGRQDIMCCVTVPADNSSDTDRCQGCIVCCMLSTKLAHIWTWHVNIHQRLNGKAGKSIVQGKTNSRLLSQL